MNQPSSSVANQPPRLLDQIAIACRKRHYSRSTEKTYRYWARQFILFHRGRAGRFVHPEQLGASEVEAVLTPAT